MRRALKSFFIGIAKSIVYIFSGVIILASLFVLLSYTFTPLLEQYRPDIEKWGSTLLSAPISIKKMRVIWYGYQPGIDLRDVIILNKETNHPALQIQRISIFYSIPQSLWQGKPILSGMRIAGTVVNIREAKEGGFSLQGFPLLDHLASQPFDNEIKINDMMQWLLQQKRLILQNIDIRYSKFTGQKKFVTLYNLNIKNDGERHLVFGQADVPHHFIS